MNVVIPMLIVVGAGFLAGGIAAAITGLAIAGVILLAVAMLFIRFK